MNKVLAIVMSIMLCFGFSAISFASVDNVYEAALISIVGDVEVDTDSDGSWMAPWVGMKLKKGAVLKTGPASYAEIVFDSEGLNVLKIKENTQIVVDKSRVDLSGGSVIAAFANLTPGSTFSVKTPNAVCGIRGSGMGVDYINGLTVTQAFEHKVYVQGIDSDGNPVGKEVVIPEGWKTQVLQDGDTTPPAELSENEKKVFNAWVDQMKKEDKVPDEGDGDDKDDPDNKDLEDIKKDDDKEDISPCGEDSSDRKCSDSSGSNGGDEMYALVRMT